MSGKNEENRIPKLDIQCQTGMLVLINDRMGDPLSFVQVYYGLMVMGYPVSCNDVVLHQGRPVRTQCISSGMLSGQELNELSLGRFLEINLSEAEDRISMETGDDITGSLCLFKGEEI